MSASTVGARRLSAAAFATLLLIAALMGSNHVAARIAFDHGVDVVSAVAIRSTATALIVGLLLAAHRVPLVLRMRQKAGLAAIGLLVAVQSVCLYSAVARLPVALALLAFTAGTAQGGLHLPNAAAGWFGLAALTLLYGSGITILFTVLPKLGVVGNSAIMNVKPVFALTLAWALLGQRIAPVQLLGSLIVVASVMWLGLRE